MLRTSASITFEPSKYSPDQELFALFMSRWLELAKNVEKSFSFKFEWEKLVWTIRANVGFPRTKKNGTRPKTNAIPIVGMRVDLLRTDQVSDIGQTKHINITQAFCDDIVFVSWESRLGHDRYESMDQLAKSVLVRLEKTRY